MNAAAPARESETIDVVVIGLGRFGRRHLEVALAHPLLRVVGVADSRRAVARAVAAETGVTAWSDDAADMVRRLRPEAVCIASSSPSHVVLAEAAAEMGAAVLVEKPVADDAAGLERLRALSASAVVMPAHVLRFSAPYVALARRLAAGELGDLVSISAERHRGRDHRRSYPSADPVSMTMVHDLDLVLWLGGEDIVEVTASGTRNDSADPTVVAQLRSDSGRLHHVRASWALEPGAGEDRLTAYGDRAIDRVEVRDGSGLRSALEAEWEEFVRCALARAASSVISVADAVHGLEIAAAIRRSLTEGGRPVRLVESRPLHPIL
ncbi:Gfo/Idh/MocA family protein [Microbacterium sp. 179-I 3D3 NHS]|uniref:Gfo/Idh/MocA family protein n=1 Tax=unclassified Microbacterium TaxID=2609290 RepID=UPI0039A3A2F7